MNMMRFVAYLTNGIRKAAMKQVVVVKKEDKCCLDNYSLELLYECQNMSVLDKEDTYSAELGGYHSPAHCWLAGGYCIANSRCAWELELLFPNNIRMLGQGLQDYRAQPTYTIKCINWESFNDAEEGDLFRQGHDYFTSHIESMTVHITYIP